MSTEHIKNLFERLHNKRRPENIYTKCALHDGPIPFFRSLVYTEIPSKTAGVRITATVWPTAEWNGTLRSQYFDTFQRFLCPTDKMRLHDAIKLFFCIALELDAIFSCRNMQVLGSPAILITIRWTAASGDVVHLFTSCWMLLQDAIRLEYDRGWIKWIGEIKGEGCFAKYDFIQFVDDFSLLHGNVWTFAVISIVTNMAFTTFIWSCGGICNFQGFSHNSL